MLVPEIRGRADDEGIARARTPVAAPDAARTRRGARLDGHARAQDRRREGRQFSPADRPQHRPDGGYGGTTSFDLPLTRADIADFLGLTIETVSRQLTKLRTEGVIRIENNRHVTVDDITRLEARSGR